MSKALVRSSSGSGVLPGVASALIPGLGQLINGEGDKALGVFVVYAVAGAGVIGAIPIVGWAAGLVAGATWIYGVGDAFLRGRRGR